MRLIRYRYRGEVGFGVVEEGRVRRLLLPPWAGREVGEVVASLTEVQLLPPVRPGKIVAVGRNYAAHAAEMGNEVPTAPLLFLKAPSSVIGPGEPILLPPQSAEVHHEAELAVVLGHRCRDLAPQEAAGVILGYTCANDVTARDLQRRDGQWARAKSFDTFCPLGPWIETDLDPTDVAVRCWVNGELRQEGRTAQMVFPVLELVAYVSQMMTLEPGDVILTGTPAGVGPLQAGDRVVVEVEGIGRLENPVRSR